MKNEDTVIFITGRFDNINSANFDRRVCKFADNFVMLQIQRNEKARRKRESSRFFKNSVRKVELVEC